jgi:ATP-dependent phosphoenolpyruvate carboxykinase
MGFGIWVLIFVVLFFVIVLSLPDYEKQNQDNLDLKLASIDDFTITKKVIGRDKKTGLAIDLDRNKICLISNFSAQASLKVILYKDILACELYENGNTITESSRANQLGGVLVGGILLGGAGAIIGGLSGKTKTTGTVDKIELRLIINDAEKPVHDISFLDIELDKGGILDKILYKNIMQEARYWHGLIEVLIKRADIEDNASVPQITSNNQGYSVADEIKKLAELRDSDLLSAAEFQKQKSRLLKQ